MMVAPEQTRDRGGAAVNETPQDRRTLEDVQQRVRQLMEGFADEGHEETYGALGLVAGMLSQVRVRCERCGRLSVAGEAPPSSAQVLDFTTARDRRHDQP